MFACAVLKVCAPLQGSCQTGMILLAGDFNGPQTLQMWGGELGVEQHKALLIEMIDQFDQRDF